MMWLFAEEQSTILTDFRWPAGMPARELAPRIELQQKENMPEQQYSIERPGIPNLDFTGVLIGKSSGQFPRVKIYRTKALNYVGELTVNQNLAQAQGGFNKPQDLINWFKAVNYGTISPDVQDAIEDAAKNDEPFKEAWNVQVA